MRDLELLRQFSETGSESAFSELLNLHLPLVYGVAMRQTCGDSSLADEIAQQTFCTLARKAGDISRETILGAWLCRTTFYIAQKAIRNEQRRRVREQQAARMQSSFTNADSENIWDELSPHIDEVINLLPEKERVAIVLRFLDQKPIGELAAALGISEEAARMRISRGLEKLRNLFAKRGITVSSIAIATLLSEKSRASVPSILFDQVRREMMHPENRSERSFSKSKSGIPHYLKLASLSLIVASLGIVIVSVSIPQSKSVSKTFDAALIKQSLEAIQTAQATEPFNLDEAAEALRKALRDPWPSRKPPYERVDQALARYGRSRRLAIPVLMEMFAGLRSSHTPNSMKLGAHGLIVLGAEASETLRDMLILYDAGDLRMLDEGVVELFASIDPDSSTISTFFERLRMSAGQEGIELTMLTDSIVARLIENNPVIETEYRGKLYELLQGDNPESRARAALISARLRSPSEPALFTNIITALKCPESFDNAQWRLEESRYAENKQWRLAAIDSLRYLRDPASVGPLSEIAHAQTVDGEVKTAAFRAIAEIDPDSGTESPEIKASISEHQQGITLAFKAQSGQASYEELVEGLKYRESVADSAWALGQNKNQALLPLPAILDAVENFKDEEATKLLWQIRPEALVERLREGGTECVGQIAIALARKKPPSREAITYLDQIIDRIDEGRIDLDSTLNSIEYAATQMDHPGLFLDRTSTRLFRDALESAITSTGKSDAAVERYRLYLSQRSHARTVRIREMMDVLYSERILYDAFISRRSILQHLQMIGIERGSDSAVVP